MKTNKYLAAQHLIAAANLLSEDASNTTTNTNDNSSDETKLINYKEFIKRLLEYDDINSIKKQLETNQKKYGDINIIEQKISEFENTVDKDSIPGYGSKMQALKEAIRQVKVNSESIALSESILDPINTTRCREIFDDNDIMKPEIVKFIKDTFSMWVEQLNPEYKIFDVKTFKAIGSSTGFQYTDTSDLDIQVLITMKEGHSFDDEIWNLFKILPNGNNVPGTQHPVNYFFVDVNNPTDLNKVENIYNLDTKAWEKQTDSKDLGIPVLYVREISRLFTDALDLSIGRYDKDLQYLKDALKLDPKVQAITDSEKAEAVDKCITQLRADIDSMRLADTLIHGFRLQAYDNNNFFHISINYMDDNDPRRSMNEAIYKTLDKFQYREKMRAKINEGQSFLEEISPTGDGE